MVSYAKRLFFLRINVINFVIKLHQALDHVQTAVLYEVLQRGKQIDVLKNVGKQQ